MYIGTGRHHKNKSLFRQYLRRNVDVSILAFVVFLLALYGRDFARWHDAVDVLVLTRALKATVSLVFYEYKHE